MEEYAAKVLSGGDAVTQCGDTKALRAKNKRCKYGKNGYDGGAARLPRVRSSRPALSSMTTNVNSTMMAPE